MTMPFKDLAAPVRRAVLTGCVVLMVAPALPAVGQTETSELRQPSDFAGIADSGTRAARLFEEMGKVLQSPRCLNCHPKADSPTQRTGVPHSPPVVRGEDGHGATGLTCQTCHGTENVAFTNGERSIPGHPDWHLAPASMGWQDKSLREICEQLKDPARNGGRSLEDIARHAGEDPLVGWAWDPGKGRDPAPGTQALFGALTRAWIASGAACPAE